MFACMQSAASTSTKNNLKSLFSLHFLGRDIQPSLPDRLDRARVGLHNTFVFVYISGGYTKLSFQVMPLNFIPAEVSSVVSSVYSGTPGSRTSFSSIASDFPICKQIS